MNTSKKVSFSELGETFVVGSKVNDVVKVVHYASVNLYVSAVYLLEGMMQKPPLLSVPEFVISFMQQPAAGCTITGASAVPVLTSATA